MKKYKVIVFMMTILILAGCSSFREIDVSEDGELRRITTEDTSEIDIPAEPKRIVLFRSIDPGNAKLLGYEAAAVNSELENNNTIENELGQEVIYLQAGDIESLKEIQPDLIVTYSPDEHFDDYSEIAPTIRLTYSAGILSPFSPRTYLTQLYYLGVILNKEDEANRIGDEWEAETTVIKRELKEQVDDQFALVVSSHDDGFMLYNEYMGYGTEAVYDVLGFQMDEEASTSRITALLLLSTKDFDMTISSLIIFRFFVLTTNAPSLFFIRLEILIGIIKFILKFLEQNCSA